MSNNTLLLESIVELSKDDLRRFISTCISEPKVHERMDFHLMLQNLKYDNAKKEIKKHTDEAITSRKNL